MTVDIDFCSLVESFFEKTAPPLEKMWDRWSDRWRPDKPYRRCKIRAAYDVMWFGRQYLAGQLFRCHLCGETNRWHVQGNERTGEIIVFVCEHRPEELGLAHWLPCRVVSTVPAQMVRKFWDTETGEPVYSY